MSKGKVSPKVKPPAFFPIAASDLMPVMPPAIKVGAREEPVQLKKFDVAVEVSGLESETTTTMTFFNPNSRPLEGRLEFPLPANSTITGYALDIDGKMIDGVIVSKEKARIVLETEIRKGVDPGIVEQLKGNVFRTRIYPIPARGERVIKLVSVAPLTIAKGDAAMHIPLPKGQKIPNFNVEIKVNRGSVRPQIGGFGNLTFSEWKDSWSAKASMVNVVPDNDLYLNLPKIPSQLIRVEEFDEEHFVSISDLLPQSFKSGKYAPKHFWIAWDASSSRKPQSVEKDMAFLGELLKEWKNVEVDLVVFRDTADKPQRFSIKDGNSKPLLKFLGSVPYDGGTNLSALNFEIKKVPNESLLLFTDGFSTIGESLPDMSSLPMHVISSDSTRDLGLLTYLSSASGGTLIDLTIMSPKDAVNQIVNPGLRLLRVDAPRGMINEVQTRFEASSGRATVYAKLKDDTTLTLVYGDGSKELHRSEIAVKLKSATKNHIISRAWAASKAIELSVLADKNQAELLMLGQKYQLVTHGTSLIVLETVAQYVEHRIVPPTSMPQWRKEYLLALKNNQRDESLQNSKKIEMVLEWWQERVQWFDQKFSYSKGFKFDSNKNRNPSIGSDGALEGGASGGGDYDSEESADSESYESSSEDSAAPAAEIPAPRSKKSSSKSGKGSLGAGESDADEQASIKIAEWSPSTPYLKAINKSSGIDAYNTYLKQVPAYKMSPAFYLDCANAFIKTDRILGLRILSNLAELNLEDPALLRVYAWRLHEANELDQAIQVMEEVRRIRPEEPQSHRDLALLLAKRLDRDKNIADGSRAAELFNKVVVTDWPHAQQIEVIVVMELNHLLAAMEKIKKGSTKNLSFIDPRLKKLLDLDVRITMTWDADQTDMDLHVVEPSGEEAYYGNNLTTIGGLVSKDITRGYGPEEYVIRKAMPGKYRIKCKYFGSSQQTLTGPVTVSATVITNYGRANEKRQLLTLRLDSEKDMVDIGEIVFGGADSAGKEVKVHAITREQLTKLKKGMLEAQIIKLLGQPERRDGSGISIMVYFLNDGTQIRLGVASGLLYVKEVHNGAELNLPLK